MGGALVLRVKLRGARQRGSDQPAFAMVWCHRSLFILRTARLRGRHCTHHCELAKQRAMVSQGRRVDLAPPCLVALDQRARYLFYCTTSPTGTHIRSRHLHIPTPSCKCHTGPGMLATMMHSWSLCHAETVQLSLHFGALLKLLSAVPPRKSVAQKNSVSDNLGGGPLGWRTALAVALPLKRPAACLK